MPRNAVRQEGLPIMFRVLDQIFLPTVSHAAIEKAAYVVRLARSARKQILVTLHMVNL